MTHASAGPLRPLSLRLALWVILCMGLLGVGLVCYSALTYRREALAKARYMMQSSGQTQAGAIQQRFEAGMDVARTLAQVLQANHKDKLGFTRDQVNALLRQVLVDNPDFLGTYTLWEPGAFDGLDQAYANRPGYDRTGRLIPYWSRSPTGVIKEEPIIDYETPGLGDFYLRPKREGREVLIEPYAYPVQGENVWMTSMIVPILDHGRFLGIAGVDLRVDFLQKMVDQVDVYHGEGKLILITHQGLIAAATGRPDLVGRPSGDPQHLRSFREHLQNPNPEIIEEAGYQHVFIPLPIGRTGTPWAVVTRVSERVIMAEADHHIRVLAAEGCAIILLSALIMFFLLRTLFVRRIQALNLATQALASGRLDTRCDLAGHDELTQLGEAFNRMAAAMGESIRDLRASRNLLTAVLDHSVQLYGLLTPEGRLLTANQAALAMVGLPLEQLLDQPLWELPWWSHDAGERERIRQAAQAAGQGRRVRLETTHQDAAGTLYRIDFSLAPIQDEQQRIQYLIAEGRDVSEHRRAEAEHLKVLEQLHHSQKMDAVGQLAGGIAHDFNNVLAGIMGAAELLLTDTLDPATREKYLRMILTASTRAAELIAKLLTFSRRNAKASTPVNLAEIVQEAATILSRTLDKRIRLTVVNLAEAPLVVGDDALLQNVFLNLGINASHAMPEGGELAFELLNLDLDATYCQASPFDLQPGPYVAIQVRDTGCGMPPEVQARIFEPFFTTKGPGQGTGLGLAAVYGAVQGHHGAITVYSEVGTGTVFHIYLPALGTASIRPVAKEQPLIQGSASILLIDDEELIRITGQKMLEDMGYRVATAGDGAQGLEAFLAAEGGFDLVILDMIMPVMGGREAFTRMRAAAPTVPVILSSGFSKDEDLQEMKGHGLAGFIRKPFRAAELSQLIAEVLALAE